MERLESQQIKEIILINNPIIVEYTVWPHTHIPYRQIIAERKIAKQPFCKPHISNEF